MKHIWIRTPNDPNPPQTQASSPHLKIQSPELAAQSHAFEAEEG